MLKKDGYIMGIVVVSMAAISILLFAIISISFSYSSTINLMFSSLEDDNIAYQIAYDYLDDLDVSTTYDGYSYETSDESITIYKSSTVVLTVLFDDSLDITGWYK